jgi:hypothetical protein
VKLRLFALLVFPLACAGTAIAGPTGLNVIPTTDLVPSGSWIGGFQNGNTNFTGVPFYRMPLMTAQTQFSLASWLEAGFDYTPTPDIDQDTLVFNMKALVFSEDEIRPNVAVGIWNVTDMERPGYYLTLSKTLNYEEELTERYRAHHRRNRKLLGRRVHVGAMVDGHGVVEPFLGTDLQLNEVAVFQADWVNGNGNALTAGIAYVLPDQRTVLTPALLFSNSQNRISGFSLNISHQFNF